jgi:hypothetical protein
MILQLSSIALVAALSAVPQNGRGSDTQPVTTPAAGYATPQAPGKTLPYAQAPGKSLPSSQGGASGQAPGKSLPTPQGGYKAMPQR